MPNVGTPPSARPQPSHTATHEWQSFEIRMRHRRAERCLLKAEVALEAGFEEDARAALDEARRLDPQTPDFETLSERIQTRRAAEAAEQHRAAEAAEQRRARHRRLAAYAAAAIILLGSGTTAVLLRDPAPAASPQVLTPSAEPPAAPAQNDPAADTGAPAAPGDHLQVKTEVQTVAPVAGTIAPPPRSDAERTAFRETAPAQKASAAPAGVGDPVLAASPTRTVIRPAGLGLAPVTGLRDAPPPAAVTTPPIAAASGVSELPGTSAVPAEPKPLPPPSDESGVRAVLARYEAAYTTLNASAAQAVWPGVDLRSLARAFESLQSQTVSLGRCAVAVTGAKASANCSGSATWTPKVGGGTRTEARNWRFELANTGRAWQIVSANTR